MMTTTAKKLNNSKKLHNMAFKMSVTQRNNIQKAIHKAIIEKGFETSSIALDHICRAFRKKENKQKSFKQLIEKMETKEVFNAIGDNFPQYDIYVSLIDEKILLK